jgi:hypothetical protein
MFGVRHNKPFRWPPSEATGSNTAHRRRRLASAVPAGAADRRDPRGAVPGASAEDRSAPPAPENMDLAQARRMPREELQRECSRRIDQLLSEQRTPLSSAGASNDCSARSWTRSSASARSKNYSAIRK